MHLRPPLLACLTLACLAPACLTPAAPARSAAPAALDWGGFGGGPDRSGVSDSFTLTQAQIATLTLKWTFKPGAMYRAQPVVAVIGGRPIMVVADDEGTVNGLDAATGAELWHFAVPTSAPPTQQGCKPHCPTGVIGTPVLDLNGLGAGRPALYVAGHDYLVALDPETGRPAPGWTEAGMRLVPAGEPAAWVKAGLNLVADPARPTGPATVVVATSGWYDQGAYHGAVLTVDPLARRVLDTYYPMSAGRSVPTVPGGSLWKQVGVSVGSYRGASYLLFGAGNGDPPAGKQETAGQGDRWVAIKVDPATGRMALGSSFLENSFPVADSDATSLQPAPAPNCPTAAIGSDKLSIAGFFPDATALGSGAIQLHLSTSTRAPFTQSLAVYRNTAYAVVNTTPGFPGATYAFSVLPQCAGLKQLWRVGVPGAQAPTLALGADGRQTLFVPSDAGVLVALDAATGAQVKNFGAVQPLLLGVVPVRNTLVAYGTGGISVYGR